MIYTRTHLGLVSSLTQERLSLVVLLQILLSQPPSERWRAVWDLDFEPLVASWQRFSHPLHFITKALHSFHSITFHYKLITNSLQTHYKFITNSLHFITNSLHFITFITFHYSVSFGEDLNAWFEMRFLLTRKHIQQRDSVTNEHPESSCAGVIPSVWLLSNQKFQQELPIEIYL